MTNDNQGGIHKTNARCCDLACLQISIQRNQYRWDERNESSIA